MSSSIQNIVAREILDSRGNPTVEVDVILADGALGRAAVPSGASTGEHEALELRDGDKKRYVGKGVSQSGQERDGARSCPRLRGHGCARPTYGGPHHARAGWHRNEVQARRERDSGRFAGNAKAAAEALGLPLFKYLGGPNAKVLPVPMANVINGGAHSDAPIDFQEFMIMPKGFDTFSEGAAGDHGDFSRAQVGAEEERAFHGGRRRRRVRAEARQRGGGDRSDSPGDQGCGLQGREAKSSSRSTWRRRSFTTRPPSNYVFKKSTGRKLTGEEIVEFYAKLDGKYPIVSIEDGCAENDWKTWKLLTDKLGDKVQLVGDDLFVTNVKFLQQGHRDRRRRIRFS